ncbi:MAG: cryptochrome/photolyase family protein [Pyrinomonadaceae bacterium]
MRTASIIFPNQLFENNPAVSKGAEVFLVEEFLFFRQYKFHKQKLKFHRASMKFYENFLKENDLKVNYIESGNKLSDIRELVPYIIDKGFEEIRFCDVADNWLERRIKKSAGNIRLKEFPTPMFLNTKEDLGEYFKSGKDKFFQTAFYKQQRNRRNILLEKDGKPKGGKWTFDSENRIKYPKNKTPPELDFPPENSFCKEAAEYVDKHFKNNFGALESDFRYPTTFKESRDWLKQFLEERFAEFGDYEDALVADEKVLNHSLLTPMLNAGLITPNEIIETTLRFTEENDIPLNSVEGFIRQIIGWREFVRGIYETAGTLERTKNFWNFDRKIPESFWDGTTGIDPVDIVIKKVLETGYCHHIERLMVLGNFMLLCEFHPNEVYCWFMELFIDAYDWVMVPNVYGMSQFADGGLFATKPYISGSNYLNKMSDFEKGDWQEIWDGLFWRFMDTHREFFKENPRLGMLVRMFDKMDPEKKAAHIKNAEVYLRSL